MRWIVIVLFATVVLASGCSHSHREFVANPDRDLTGLNKMPVLPDNMRLLRRVAIKRYEWHPHLTAAEAQHRIVEGLKACHVYDGRMSDIAFIYGALGTAGTGTHTMTGFFAGREIVVEPWPELDAVAIGPKFRSLRDRGFPVMYVVHAPRAGPVVVYAYHRQDTKLQTRWAQHPLIWLAGRTRHCD